MSGDLEARVRQIEYRTMRLDALIRSMKLGAGRLSQGIGAVTIGPSNSSTFTGSITVTVLACDGTGINGASVSVTGPNSFTDSGTTDSAGQWTFSIPEAGTYNATSTTTITGFQSSTGSVTAASGSNSIVIHQVAAINYQCSPCCTDPIPTSLQLSDNIFGTCSLNYNSATGTWRGAQLSTQLTLTNLISNDTQCGSNTQGSTLLIYDLSCVSGSWYLSVSYDGCQILGSAYYQYPLPESLPANTTTVSIGSVLLFDGPVTGSTCSPFDQSVTFTPANKLVYNSNPTITITV